LPPDLPKGRFISQHENIVRQIHNVRELRASIRRGNHEFRLRLNGGVFSRKTIGLCDDGSFSVFNGIDGSMEKLTGRELYTESAIGEGMRRGAFLEDG